MDQCGCIQGCVRVAPQTLVSKLMHSLIYKRHQLMERGGVAFAPAANQSSDIGRCCHYVSCDGASGTLIAIVVSRLIESPGAIQAIPGDGWPIRVRSFATQDEAQSITTSPGVSYDPHPTWPAAVGCTRIVMQ
jgi:hypothetical protein